MMSVDVAWSDRNRLLTVSKAGMKSALRRYAIATSSFRCLPDFLIIGAKRAASTTLWNSVVSHPSVMPLFPARLKTKGTGYFSINYRLGPAWYRSHFPLQVTRDHSARHGGSPPVVGEATPYYLFHPLAPKRAKRIVPETKLIAILRNPVDRAYSHYRERVRHGAETLPFEEALDAEPDRTRGEEERILADASYRSVAHEDLSYVAQGCYAASLERWLSEFRRDCLLVILNEDFDRDPARELQRIWDFLGIPSWQAPRMDRYNYHPFEPMRPATRERLIETFEPHNRRLERLLNRDLGDWYA
jgi:hypothetical protein